MNKSKSNITCDIAIIGAGMAGSAAALFAADRGINTALIGMKKGLLFISGMIDLMGVHPVKEGRLWMDPWQAIDFLKTDYPRHPYSLLHQDDIRSAISKFLSFLNQGGLPYYSETQTNIMALTPVGTMKPTYAVPKTFQNGIHAIQKKADTLLIDFEGLKGFSGRQLTETLKNRWPGLSSRRLAFPGGQRLSPMTRGQAPLPGVTAVEQYPELMAQRLEMPEVRAELAEMIWPLIKDADYIGLPAILGIHHSETIFQDLQDRIQRPLFEIPTIHPSIAGLRMGNLFETMMSRLGIQTVMNQQILKADHDPKNGFQFQLGREPDHVTIHARGAILATGRFLGGGLRADRRHIFEPLFGLPVHQPRNRNQWHRKLFLDPKGHSINQSGIETDTCFRPLGKTGQPEFPTLFAAGSILAHQDWMRMKCGSGLAITTAYAAVKAFAEMNGYE